MILAIDTSAGQCAVALVGEARSAVRIREMTRGHAEALFPMIDEVLAELDAGYPELTKVAVCTGPGSFTGLRAGISAARGVALGRDIPAVGITRFEAIAAEEKSACTVRLPGRGRTVFTQRFDDSGKAIAPPVIETGEAEDRLPDPALIARLAMDRMMSERPAPLYLRDADAALPKDGPPPLID